MTIEPRTDDLSQAPGPGPRPAPDAQAPGLGPVRARTDINDSGPESITGPGPEAWDRPRPYRRDGGDSRAPGPRPEAWAPGPEPEASGPSSGPGPEAQGRWARVRAWAREDSEAPGPGPQASGSGPGEASGPAQARGPKGRPVVREPRWLRITILLGLYGLTIAGLVLASSGQIEAAESEGVKDGRQYLAPFVLELNALLWTLMGYRRGRRGHSPNMFWLLAAASGAFSIYLVTAHAPSEGAALLYAGASAAAQLLTFVHLKENLDQFLTDVLGQTAGSRAKYGMLWLTDFGLARRAWLIDVEHSVGVREDTIAHAQLYRVVYDGVLASLVEALSWNNWVKKRRARKLADRTARRYVAIQCGAPVMEVPTGGVQVMEISNVVRAPGPGPGVAAGPEAGPAEIEAGPATPGPVLSGPVVGPEVGPRARGPVGPEARSGPRPGPRPPAGPKSGLPGPKPAGPASVPVSPAPAGPSAGARARGPAGTDPRTIDTYLAAIAERPPALEGNITDLTYYRTDLINLAERTADGGSGWKTDEGIGWETGDWLTRPEYPTKKECGSPLGRGSTHAGNIRRIVEAIREHVRVTEAN